MEDVGGVWKSEFPNKTGAVATIDKDAGQVTVASYKSRDGGHAMMYLEYLEGSLAIVKKVHLIANETKEGTKIEILEEDKQIGHTKVGDSTKNRADEYQYKGYIITSKQRVALDAAILRFKAKNLKGRYSYSTPGGFLGRLTTLPKKRGVNCADFIIKVLEEAGITKISSDLFNTPKRIAGGSIFK